MPSKTVMVTGGSGFIAGWCIVELLKQGYRVRTTIRSPEREPMIRRSLSGVFDAGGRLSFAVADLMADPGWDAAVAGCDLVLHLASPLGREAPRDRDALVAPARDGALRVLKAAVAAGVDRIVMTSAAAAARRRGSTAVSDETIWADAEDPLLDPYRRSKILAERAAWDYMATVSGRSALTTILPAAVFGPILPGSDPAAVWVIANLLQGRPPRLLNLGLSIVDVRDLAAAHVVALTAPAAAGERFLATGTFLWMRDIARVLREGLGETAGRVPRRVLPDAFVRLLALAMPQLRMFRHDLGQRRDADDSKARRLLGFARRPVEETILECARSVLHDTTAIR